MTLLSEIQAIFPPERNDISLVEKYSSVETRYKTSITDVLTESSLTSLINSISNSDRHVISIIIDGSNPITTSSNRPEVAEFVESVQKEKDDLEDESVVLDFSINKETSRSLINIYSFSSFTEFIDTLDVASWLGIIKGDLKKNGFLKFKVRENHFTSFRSKNIIFSKNGETPDRLKDNSEAESIKENCHFGSYDTYPFSPTHFNLTKRPRTENSVSLLFDKLSFVFSIISIFDISSLESNELYYKINGFKTIEGKINIDETAIQSRDIYYKIFQWIYSDKTNSTDKIGLARNILSIYLKADTLDIEENVYFSIQSGFKTYLQENINKYIEIRNKISEQLIEISNRALQISEEYLSSFEKSNIPFITFFITVLVIQSKTFNSGTQIFNKDTTIIALTLILLSFAYMAVSLLKLNSDISRLGQKYLNIKSRFKDLLIEDDINKILQNDDEFNREIKFIKQRRKWYSLLWGGTIVAFTIVIITLSTYITWEMLKSAFLCTP